MVVKYVLRRIFIVMNWLIKYCLGEFLYLAPGEPQFKGFIEKGILSIETNKNSQPN